MYNLLTINGVVFPTPEGSFVISKEDLTNDYKSDAGTTVVEVVREGVFTIDVSYIGQLEHKMDALCRKLSTVNTVVFTYDGFQHIKQMKLEGLKKTKVAFRHGISVWSLSFSLKEL